MNQEEAQTPEIMPAEPPKPVELPKQNAQALIAVSTDGRLQPKDHVELKSVIAQMHRGGGFPKHLDTIEKAIMAWQYSLSLKVEPLLGVKNIAIINGNPSIFGDLPLALAERTNELVHKKEYWIDAEYKEISVANKNLGATLFAAVCEIQRKGRQVQTFSFTVDQAKKARLWEKPNTPWQTYPDVMLKMRARSIALKAEFADAIAGARIAEYDEDAIVVEGEVLSRPVKNVAADLNKAYLEEDGKV